MDNLMYYVKLGSQNYILVAKNNGDEHLESVKSACILCMGLKIRNASILFVECLNLGVNNP